MELIISLTLCLSIVLIIHIIIRIGKENAKKDREEYEKKYLNQDRVQVYADALFLPNGIMLLALDNCHKINAYRKALDTENYEKAEELKNYLESIGINTKEIK